MLAVLQIKMRWTKENRTPVAAVQRRQHYAPVMIEDGVALAGNGIFVKKCDYYQKGDRVLSNAGVLEETERRLHEKNRNVPFAGQDEHGEKRAWRWNRSVQREKGAFYNIADFYRADIPCIEIAGEPDARYRVKWSDCGRGMPRRRGGNEDLYRPGARLAGQTGVCNETAFVLEEGGSGVLKYNYRMTSYDGQWYECYYVYVVNAAVLTQDIFVRVYDHEYDQIAELF